MMPMALKAKVILMKDNKLLGAFKMIFKGIYKVLDKILITPISTVVYKIGNKIGKGSKLEKLLNKPNMLIYLSLIFAIILFWFVDSQSSLFVNNDALFLTNIPVKVQYNSSAYVIEGVPDTVDVTLIGKKSQLYLARDLGDREVILDLTDYQASDEPVKVKLSYNKQINNLEYKIDPGSVSVIIKEKVSDNKTVTYDLLNQDALDPKLSVKSVTLSKSDVIVRGSQDTLDKIATIKALIDLGNEDFTKAGSYTIDNLNLVAYGSDGRIVNNVEIVATNISAKIELDSFSKRVPIRINTTGSLVEGKAISSITINGTNANDFETTIYGDEKSLENINEIVVTIDVDKQGSNGSKTSSVTLPKPSGVRSISDESVSIVLNFGDAKQRTIKLQGISSRNVPNGLTAQLANESDKEIEIQLIGVESVINAIDENTTDITAYVDLTGKTAGRYTVDVMVEGSDSRLQYIVTKKVEIILTNS